MRLDQTNLGQPNQVCQMCNPLAKFYLSSGNCVLSTQTSCALISQTNTCLRCNSGYSLNSGNCVQITSTYTVANCTTFNTNGLCTQCNTGYGVSSSGTCFQVTKTNVTNCINYDQNTMECIQCSSGYYLSANNQCPSMTTTAISNCVSHGADSSGNILCLKCSSGFTPNVQQAACVTIPNIQGCLYASNYSCQLCNSSYFLTQDSYKISLYTTKFNANSLGDLNILIGDSAGNQTQIMDGVSICTALDATANCKNYATYNTCSSCNSGYYMNFNTNRCISNPQSPIPNCLIYTSNSVCNTCSQGYYPNSTNGQCIAIAVTDILGNCIQYSQTATTKTCTLCATGYYISNGSSACTARTNSNIAKCLVYSANSDDCSKCEPNYQYHSGTKKCLDAIPNCITVDGTNLSVNGGLICTACDTMFYVSKDPIDNSTICLKNTIPYCIQSHASYNYCTKCANQYFGYGVCNGKHTAINQCVTYNNLKAHICTQCQDNSIPIAFKKQCIAQNQIANCQEHVPLDNNSLMCRRCNSGYYPQTPTLCTSITSTTNCDLALDDGLCIRCNVGFVLVQNPTTGNPICITPFSYSSNDCGTYNYDTTAFAASFTNRLDLQTTAQKSLGTYINQISVLGGTQTSSIGCRICNSTGTVNGTDYVYYYNWTTLAPLINVNYCIENSQTTNNVQYLAGSEYTPVYPSNCMIYGPNRSCYRCALGYFLLTVSYSAGYGTGVNQCVAKDTTFGYCDQTKTGSVTLIPFSLKLTSAGNRFQIDRFEYCTAKTLAGTNNFDLVLGQDVYQLQQATPAYANIVLMCKQFITTMPTQTFTDIFSNPYSNLNPFATAANGATSINWIGNSLDVYPKVDCLDTLTSKKFENAVDSTAVTLVDGGAVTAIDSALNGYSRDATRREMWFKVITTGGTDFYARARCGRDKIPTMNNRQIDGANTAAYVQCLTALTSADTTYDNSVWYNNMNAHDSYFMNIHGCKTANYIPFLVIKTKTTGSLLFDSYLSVYKNATDWIGTTTGGLLPPIVCADISTDVSMQTQFFGGSIVALDAGFAAAGAKVRKMPTQCAYGVFSATYTTANFDYSQGANQAANKVAISCRACKPGYKPVWATLSGTAFTGLQFGESVPFNATANSDCVQITNCSSTVTQTYLNVCTQCNTATGYALEYKANMIDMYSSCVNAATSAANNYRIASCYMFDKTSDKCVVCIPGFFITTDFACEQITVKNCTSFTAPIVAINTAFPNATNVFAYQFSQGNGVGCQSCATGFQLVNMLNSGTAADHYMDVCGVSNYVLTTNFNTNNTLKYCNKFGKGVGSDAIVCYGCQTGYVLKSDNSACLVNTNILNCTVATSATQCLTCASGYSLIKDGTPNPICSNTSSYLVTNCNTHFSDANTTLVTDALTTQDTTVNINATITTDLQTNKFLCRFCNNGYYLTVTGASKFQTCTLGTIKNCQVYSNQYNCKTCNTGYQLFRSSNAGNATQYDTCIAVPTDNTCSYYTFDFQTTFGKTTLTTAIVEATCAKCGIANGQVLSVDSTNTYENYPTGMAMAECRTFDKILNCATYGSYLSWSNSNALMRFGCSFCLANYYLNPAAASLYTITANTSYLSDSCLVRTYIDPNCLQYLPKDDQCGTCAFGYYLDSSGKCKQSPSGILNCSTYSSATVCTACQGDFYLSNNACYAVGTAVTNCGHYSADSICDSCNTGTYLDTTQNKCISNTLSNCVVQLNATTCTTCATGYALNSANGSCVQTPNCTTTNTSGSCSVCNSGYYPNSSGVCTQVSPLINNCNLYSSNTKCFQCNAGYALSTDGASCYKINVTDSQCSSYTLNAQPQCQACTVGYNYIGSSCQLTPLPEKDKLGCMVFNGNLQICQICLPGYAMDYNGLCLNSSTLSLLNQPYEMSAQDRLLR